MAFRTNEYLERNELVRYQLDDVIRMPANGQKQHKNGYKFTINDRSSLYDWYNAYFEVRFQLQKPANGATTGADRITVINGSHSLINHLIVKSAGKIVYDTNNLHKVTFVKNLLEFSDDYSRSIAKDSFWYLDVHNDYMTAAGNSGFEARRVLTTGLKNNNVIIPINRYSFFEELEDKMLPAMQLQFEINLQIDNELINAGDDCRVVIDRFLLWVPKMIPKTGLSTKFTESFIIKKSWNYLREMFTVSAPARSSGFFQISSSIDNVKSIFVYLQRDKTNDPDQNPYLFDTYKIQVAANDGNVDRYLTTCRLEYGNGIFYPETDYDSESKVRIFNDLMSYADRKNDYNTGTQLNLDNYNHLYSLIYFDLSYQTEKVTRDPKQLIFRYKLNANTDVDFNVHAVVLYKEEFIIDKIKNEVVIV